MIWTSFKNERMSFRKFVTFEQVTRMLGRENTRSLFHTDQDLNQVGNYLKCELRLVENRLFDSQCQRHVFRLVLRGGSMIGSMGYARKKFENQSVSICLKLCQITIPGIKK